MRHESAEFPELVVRQDALAGGGEARRLSPDDCGYLAVVDLENVLFGQHSGGRTDDADVATLHGDDVAAVGGIVGVARERHAVGTFADERAVDQDGHAHLRLVDLKELALFVRAELPQTGPDSSKRAFDGALAVALRVAERRAEVVIVEGVGHAGGGGGVEAGAVELESVLRV